MLNRILFLSISSLIISSVAHASSSYEYACDLNIKEQESSTRFVSIDPSGSRVLGLRVEGEENEEYKLADIAQFKFQSAAVKTELFVWHQPQAVGAYGFKIDVSGKDTLTGVYQILKYSDSLQMEIEYTAPITCILVP